MRKVTPTKPLTRRGMLLGATAAAAALAGARQSNATTGPMHLQPVAGSPDGPDFTLPDLDGKLTRFSDLRGRIVLVNFWATWCPPCKAEIPSMERAWAMMKDRGAVMLAVHVGGDADKIWEFLSEMSVTFPVLIDKSGSVSKQWQTIGLPTTYVANRAGQKVLRAIGGREWDHPDIVASVLGIEG